MIWPPNTPQLVSLYTQQASDTFFLRPPLLKKVAPGGTPLPLGTLSLGGDKKKCSYLEKHFVCLNECNSIINTKDNVFVWTDFPQT